MSPRAARCRRRNPELPCHAPSTCHHALAARVGTSYDRMDRSTVAWTNSGGGTRRRHNEWGTYSLLTRSSYEAVADGTCTPMHTRRVGNRSRLVVAAEPAGHGTVGLETKVLVARSLETRHGPGPSTCRVNFAQRERNPSHPPVDGARCRCSHPARRAAPQIAPRRRRRRFNARPRAIAWPRRPYLPSTSLSAQLLCSSVTASGQSWTGAPLRRARRHR